MTRETKLGLAVATSFLSLVGGVLGVKLYRGDGPAADAPPEAVAKAEAPKAGEPSPESPAVNNVPDIAKDQAKADANRQAMPPAPAAAAIPVQPVAVAGVTPPNAEATPPAPAMPVAPVVQLPAPQPPAEPAPAPLKPDADAVSLTKSEAPDAKKPDAAPPAPAPVVAPPVVPDPNANAAPAPAVVPPPPAPVMVPPPPVVPTAEPKKDEPPAPTALPLAQATLPAPVTTDPKKDEPPPAVVPPPPAPVMTEPKKDEPPAPTSLPPAPAVAPPAPAAVPPAPATPDPKKEEPPQKLTFDKPSNASGITLPPPPATSAPPAPLSPDINKKAEPTVTVIPATAPSSLGTPTARPGDPFVAAPPRPAPQPKTQSYLEEEHRWQPGDSFRAVSERYYAGSPKYEAALRAYNRDYPLAGKAMKQNAATLPPGTTVWVPPVRILERDYRDLISDAPLPGGTPGLPTSRLVSPAPPPAATAPPYRVRAGETMYEIARRTLGGSDQWFQIHRLNPTLSNDPKLPIPAGTLLRLPANAKLDPADRP